MATPLGIPTGIGIAAYSIDGINYTSTPINQPVLYIIEIIGSTFYAVPAPNSGLTFYSGSDARTVINNAFASMVNGGTLLLREGLYSIGSPNIAILIPSNCTLRGSGPGTIIQFNGGTGMSNLITNLHKITGTPRDTDITIADITVDGNRTNGTGGGALSFSNVDRLRLQNIWVKNILGDGIGCGNNNFLDTNTDFFFNNVKTEGHGADGFALKGVTGLYMNNCISYNCGDHTTGQCITLLPAASGSANNYNCYFTNCVFDMGFQNCALIRGTFNSAWIGCTFSNAQSGSGVSLGSNPACTDLSFIGCTAYNNSQSGIAVSSGPLRLTFSSCHFYNNSIYGFSTNGSTFNTLMNCQIYNNTKHGIQFSSSSDDGSIIGGVVYNNSQYGTGSYHGIYITSCNRTLIQGVHISGSMQHYGIEIGSGSNSQIANCVVGPDNIGGISVQGGTDNMVIMNRLISEGIPIDINHVAGVNTLLMGNDWNGCTNDVNTGSATTPLITNNVGRSGSWWTTGNNPV